MSDRLRDEARRALGRLSSDESSGASVTRLTIDVELGGRSEWVSVALRDGELISSTTGSEAHLRAALRWLAGTASGGEAERPSEPGPRPSRPSRAESPSTSVKPASYDRFAEALDDVVTVLVRAGTGAASSPSVAESLERLRREGPLPTPSGLGRWLARLGTALERGDAALVALLLEGAVRLADELRIDRTRERDSVSVDAWLGTASGASGGLERVSDRVMLEVAREQLATAERGGLERRYLVDLSSGEVLREERSRTSGSPSVGPCPRLIQVGLAEIEPGIAPRSVRLLQYEVSLEVGADILERLTEVAHRDFAAVAEQSRALFDASPGLAEPFFVVAPRAHATSSGASTLTCTDDGDASIHFAQREDLGATEALARLAEAARPKWVAGRVVLVDGSLRMVPCSVGLEVGESTHFARLR